MSNPFRFVTWDILTRTKLEELPLTSATFGKEVNSNGGFTGYLPITDPNVREDIDWKDTTKPGKTFITVHYLNKIIWGGILWTRNYTKSTGMLELGASQLGSYFSKRLQAQDYTSNWALGGAPMQIARRIVRDLEAFGVTDPLVMDKIIGRGELGSKAPFSFPISSPQKVDAMIQQLSSMGPFGGFDYVCELFENGITGALETALFMQIPFLGRQHGFSGPLFKGVNELVLRAQDLKDWDWPEDATGEAWHIVGQASGGTKVEVTDFDRENGTPLLEDLLNSPVSTDAFSMRQIAYGQLFTQSHPVTNPPAVVPLYDAETGKVGWTSFADFNLGDEILFQIDAEEGGGRNTDPRFPEGLEVIRRCTTWNATVEPQGLSTVNMVLNASPLRFEFTEYAPPEFSTEEETPKEREEKSDENNSDESAQAANEPTTEAEHNTAVKNIRKRKSKRKKVRRGHKKMLHELKEGLSKSGCTPEQLGENCNPESQAIYSGTIVFNGVGLVVEEQQRYLRSGLGIEEGTTVGGIEVTSIQINGFAVKNIRKWQEENEHVLKNVVASLRMHSPTEGETNIAVVNAGFPDGFMLWFDLLKVPGATMQVDWIAS